MLRRGSCIEEDEVLSDRNRTLLLCSFSIAPFSTGFREARAASRNARVLPAAPPLHLFRAQTSRHRHLFAGLFCCNQSRSLLFICHLLIYILLCPYASSVSSGRVPVFLFSFVTGHLSLSLFPLLSPALWFETPVVPPRFSTHARSNATAYHESPWAGHRGTWATFEKLKEKYWWPGLYQTFISS